MAANFISYRIASVPPGRNQEHIMTTPAYLLKSQRESAARLAAKRNSPLANSGQKPVKKEKANVGARRRPKDDKFEDAGAPT